MRHPLKSSTVWTGLGALALLLTACGTSAPQSVSAAFDAPALEQATLKAVNARLLASPDFPADVRVLDVSVTPERTVLNFTAATRQSDRIRLAALDRALSVLPGVLGGQVRHLEVQERYGGEAFTPAPAGLRAQAYECTGATRFEGGTVRDRPLSITGARVILNPGHGYYRLDTGALQYQREAVNPKATPPVYAQEDTSNLEMAIAAAAALSPTGAVVESVRELSKAAGSGTTGKPQWEEAAIHHLAALGNYPAGVWNSAGNALSGDCALGRDIRARPFAANFWAADALVGLHSNAYSDPSVRGTRIYFPVTPFLTDTPGGTPANARMLAQALGDALRDAIRTKRPDLSWPEPILVPSDDYGETGYARMPSVIVEIGFHTNPVDGQALNEDSFRQAVAEGVKTGLVKYFGAATPTAPVWQMPATVVLNAGTVGGMAAQGSVPLKNAGGAGTYAAVSSASTLAVTPNGGPLEAAGSQTLLLKASCTVAGPQMATLSVTGGGASVAVTVTWTCASMPLPATPAPVSVSMSTRGRIQVTWPEVAGAQTYVFRATFDGAELAVEGQATPKGGLYGSAVARFTTTPDAPDKQGKAICLSVSAVASGQSSPFAPLSCTTYRSFIDGIVITPLGGRSGDVLRLSPIPAVPGGSPRPTGVQGPESSRDQSSIRRAR